MLIYVFSSLNDNHLNSVILKGLSNLHYLYAKSYFFIACERILIYVFSGLNNNNISALSSILFCGLSRISTM